MADVIYTFLEGIDDAALLRLPAPMDEELRDIQHAKPHFMDRPALSAAAHSGAIYKTASSWSDTGNQVTGV